jgi:hypothetical protein
MTFKKIKIVSPYIIYDYLWLFKIILNYFSLFHFKLFLAIVSFFYY